MKSAAVAISPRMGVRQTTTHRATADACTTRVNPRRSGQSGGVSSRRRSASTISRIEMQRRRRRATQTGAKAGPGAKSAQ